MSRVLMFFFTALALAGSANADGLPSVETILSRFAEAVGGRNAIAAVRERHYRGVIVQDLSWDDPQHSETPFVATADANGVVRYAESGDWGELRAAEATGLPRKLRWLLHPRFALVVEDFFPGLRVDRREVRAGRNVVVLVPEGLKPEYYALYFDEETGLLNHVGYHNDLGDWRTAGGVLFPHRWAFGRKGGHTTYTFRQVADSNTP